jgi:hypothetical protein
VREKEKGMSDKNNTLKKEIELIRECSLKTVINKDMTDRMEREREKMIRGRN